MSEAEKNSKKVIIALGSNISPEINIPLALNALKEEFGDLESCSSIWQTKAVGSDGPDFLNAMAAIQTNKDIAIIKSEILRPLEEKMGRVRTSDKNSPRTIDLDILIYEEQLMEDELWEQVHMAVPLAEIWPNYTHPESRIMIAEIARQLQEKNSITGVELKG